MICDYPMRVYYRTMFSEESIMHSVNYFKKWLSHNVQMVDGGGLGFLGNQNSILSMLRYGIMGFLLFTTFAAASLNKKVTISIHESLPLKHAFVTLSRLSGVNIKSRLPHDERIHYFAENKAIETVLKEICDIAELRYIRQGTMIHIHPDSPYVMTYNVQFLNMKRTVDNNVSIATDVFANSGEVRTLTDNGSSSHINAKGESDFWSEVQANLRVILGEDSGKERFTIHRQGGMIVVHATEKQQQLVQAYLKRLKRAISTQVLIEAKIVEVILKDDFKAGINWQKLTGGTFRVDAPFGSIAQAGKGAATIGSGQDILAMGMQQENFSSILQAIQQYGECRTISSPRLTVLNNQNAILKVAQNQVYFRIHYDRQYGTHSDRENIAISSDIQTVPIGLVMAVQPSIDADTGEIILLLRPTISRLSRSVSDPAVDLVMQAHSPGLFHNAKPSLIPVVEVREMDSVLRLKSGHMVVLGGLMESRRAEEVTKLPILGDIPILGEIVTARSESEEVVELVVILKVTVLEDAQGLAAGDLTLMQRAQAPREKKKDCCTI